MKNIKDIFYTYEAYFLAKGFKKRLIEDKER
jgi:hypothetical protein